MGDWFAWLVEDARIAHLALLVLAVEGLVLVLFRSRFERFPRGLFLNVATGAALMLIVRAALLGRPALEIVALFGLAFALHLADALPRAREALRRRDASRSGSSAARGD